MPFHSPWQWSQSFAPNCRAPRNCHRRRFWASCAVSSDQSRHQPQRHRAPTPHRWGRRYHTWSASSPPPCPDLLSVLYKSWKTNNYWWLSYLSKSKLILRFRLRLEMLMSLTSNILINSAFLITCLFTMFIKHITDVNNPIQKVLTTQVIWHVAPKHRNDNVNPSFTRCLWTVDFNRPMCYSH